MVHIPAVTLARRGHGTLYSVPSSSRPDKVHFVIKLDDSGVICTCEGWQFNHNCKHARAVPGTPEEGVTDA